MLIHTIAGIDQADAQRKTTTPSMLQELLAIGNEDDTPLDPAQENEQDNEDGPTLDPHKEENQLETMQPVEQTPRAVPRKRQCLPKPSKRKRLRDPTFDMIRKKGVCHLWHEGVAKRGAKMPVGSCMFQYVTSHAEKGAKKFYSFSDSCGAAKLNITWEHCFLEPGHTQNENDLIHARIESEAKLKEIFDMDEWVTLIQKAKQQRPKAFIICVSEVYYS
ncbi:hypothetical protein FOCC_FOCC016565 [Frankliniella occidentalis]|nr:hypothetical protein FOCC_FOCC016565 [Frankliniella occidentalis]